MQRNEDAKKEIIDMHPGRQRRLQQTRTPKAERQKFYLWQTVAGGADPDPYFSSLAAINKLSIHFEMPTPHHLKRLDWAWQKQPVYFVTSCVAGRRKLLATPDVHTLLHEEWSGLLKRHGWAVGRYVVMPDHVHFFISPIPTGGKSLSQTIGTWKEWTAKRILKSTGKSAPLWQPEFFDHLLRSDESLAEKWNYVYENPVRARLAIRAEDWPYAGSVDFA
jgi:REP element-mobilizing transposase RayT